MRSQLEYAAPVFSTSLPDFLVEKLESVQRRALFIIFKEKTYRDALKKANLKSLQERRIDYVKRFLVI